MSKNDEVGKLISIPYPTEWSQLCVLLNDFLRPLEFNMKDKGTTSTHVNRDKFVAIDRKEFEDSVLTKIMGLPSEYTFYNPLGTSLAITNWLMEDREGLRIMDRLSNNQFFHEQAGNLSQMVNRLILGGVTRIGSDLTHHCFSPKDTRLVRYELDMLIFKEEI